MKFGVTVRPTEATGGDYSGGFLCRTDSKPIGHSATVAWHAERLESSRLPGCDDGTSSFGTSAPIALEESSIGKRVRDSVKSESLE
jgi:hypothetical protein